MAIDKIFNDANVDGIADNIFGAVNNSVSEVKQMQQRKAAENVQMVVEAFKKIETNITEKFDNVTDVIEKRVLTIKDGRDGSNGSDGRNGRDGKPGRDGVNGKQGTPGTPGKDGVDGKDGVSVTNANIDFDGSLVISLSSGQQINVGEVVAPDLAEKIKIVSTMSTNGAVGIKDEGSSISTGVKNINFVGATVTATASGDDVTVNVSAGTGTVQSVAATVPAFLSVAGSPITTTGTLAISLSGTALPVANGGTGITSFGTGVATFLGTPSSANLAAAVTGETGTGALVFATSPTLVTPALGAATGTSLSLTGTLSGGTSGTAYSFSGSAPATSLTLDASGQLGIAAATPGAKLDISFSGGTGGNTTLALKLGADVGGNTTRTVNTRKFAAIGGANYSNSAFNIGMMHCDSDSTTSTIIIGGGSSGVYDATSIQFVTAATTTSTTGTTKMLLDSSGNLLVGATASGVVGCILTSIGRVEGTVSSVSTSCLQAWNQATSGDNKFVEFYTEGGGGTLRGSITYNRAGGLTAYNVTSDYRAKDITGPVVGSGAVIDSVPVYMGKMKDATQERPMFIAHEVPAYAHTGVKDAVDADGNPVYQQMDASALIPVMWAELQSLRARVAQLESKL